MRTLIVITVVALAACGGGDASLEEAAAVDAALADLAPENREAIRRTQGHRQHEPFDMGAGPYRFDDQGRVQPASGRTKISGP